MLKSGNCKALTVGVVLVCLGAASNVQAAPGDVTLLTYPGSTSNYGGAINGRGDVAGAYDQGNAFRRSAAGEFEPVTYPIYTESQPREYDEPPIIPVGYGDAISDNGIVAGRWGDRSYHIYRTYINVGGTYTAMPKPANYWTYQVSGVSNDGVAVGTMQHDVNETGRAWRWTGSGEVHDLGTLGGQQSFGHGINNGGVVVGTASTLASTHAYRWTESGGMRSIHSLGVSSDATDINDAGVVVGSYTLAGDHDRAFRWSESGGMQTLAMLPGKAHAAAAFVNEGGWVIGTQWDSDYGAATHTLWTLDGAAHDLLAWVKRVNPTEGDKLRRITWLRGISDDGMVLGQGTYNDGTNGWHIEDRPFLLDVSSIPEPSSLAAAAAVLSIGALRRRPCRHRTGRAAEC